MVTRSTQTHSYRMSFLPANKWRCFALDIICGLLAVTWYFLMRAEQITLQVLCALERFYIHLTGHRPGDDRTQNSLFDEEE